jgi:PAS domain S-box-containing protein
LVETPVENRSADNEKYVSKSDLNSSLIEILNKTSTDTSFEIFFTSISDTILSTIRGISKISFYLVDQKIRTIQLLGQFDSRLKYISAIEGGEELEIIRGFDETILGLTAEAGEPSSTGTQQMVEYDGNEICIPIKFNNVTIGLIQAEREICEYFTNKDIKFFSYFANAIGGFMKSKLLSQQLSRSEVKLLNLNRELNRSLDFQKRIMESMDEGLIIEDKNLRVIYINPKAENELGYKKEELEGLSYATIISESSIIKVHNESKKQKNGERTSYRATFLKKDKSDLPVLVQAAPIFQNSIFNGILLAFTNISPVIEIEEEIEWLKSYHQTILDNLPIGIIGLKHDSQIDYSNQYIQSFIAKPLKGRLIQEILSDLFDETIAYSILTALEESFKEERGFSLNEIPIVLNEIQKKLNIVFIPLFDQSEKIFRGLLIIDDDTESYTLIDRLRSAYKQIEERQDHIIREVQQKTEFQRKLLSTTKELRQKHKEMESFIYSVSHDLKTPIVSIQGYISALLEEMGESSIDNSKIYLERIRKNADYSSKLIRDILEYSRIGQEELNIQEVISLEIIHSAVNTIKSQIGVKEFKIEIQTAPYPKIICQAERIHQVFVNLIHNAFKYRNKSLKDPYLLISMEEEEKFWVFVFTDNGVGLSENQRDKMFIMFERGYDSFSESIEGSGIGLAFSKKIVEIHNGRITVDSEKGIGSTFRIWLPKKASFQKGRIY